MGALPGRKSFPSSRDMDEAFDILLVELSRIIKIQKTSNTTVQGSLLVELVTRLLAAINLVYVGLNPATYIPLKRRNCIPGCSRL